MPISLCNLCGQLLERRYSRADPTQSFPYRKCFRTFREKLQCQFQLPFGILCVSLPGIDNADILPEYGELRAIPTKLDRFLHLSERLGPVIVFGGLQREIVQLPNAIGCLLASLQSLELCHVLSCFRAACLGQDARELGESGEVLRICFDALVR